ncbi:uncharacterized protein CcaverHIS019_0406260 [Cutaneotrichosporon cavernicola]|uniref:Uncharacterized protein n=1 Tax=Cutaneotrichosporon cavernicola TaxID=279322 RepID=A0AA48L4G5_9TREE|nr:uncharacterized protein CcaverHIS019_0406260 [Cutaneotrichosporon cavernicola]BEI91806.1 hypothetical protein CcaverHIS019_0406260 [Cutaneotrichosporon cavernicola]BEI99577.1 hypothetical protein CcaverHIS631_0406200 [Cutaneotrichosporon cavernicola]
MARDEDEVSIWSFEEQSGSWCCFASKKPAPLAKSTAQLSPSTAQLSPDSQRVYRPNAMQVPPSSPPSPSPAPSPSAASASASTQPRSVPQKGTGNPTGLRPPPRIHA